VTGTYGKMYRVIELAGTIRKAGTIGLIHAPALQRRIKITVITFVYVHQIKFQKLFFLRLLTEIISEKKKGYRKPRFHFKISLRLRRYSYDPDH
jgi:hypothetical protein